MSGVEPTPFLVFSDDWGEHPSSCQHLFRHIARTHPTVWVNTVGMRAPRLNRTDLRKALGKLRRMASGNRNVAPASPEPPPLHLTVCQPPMLPFPGSALSRMINRASVVRSVRRALRAARVERPVLVSTVPNAGDCVGSFGERGVVYYCVDDFAEWPGLDRGIIRAMEAELIQETDVFVATSESLRDRLAKAGKPTHLLTHGVDVAHFANVKAGKHPLLDTIPEPRVGYFGLFDERSDQQLMKLLAERTPGVSFVVTGRVEVDVRSLEGVPNVYFTGPVPYDDLPSLVVGWSACLLPYVRNELSEAINPLKLKEYLATGKAVVSTPIPEALRLSPFVTCCSEPEEWCRAIARAIESPPRSTNELLANFLAAESWEGKVLQFLEFLRASHLL